LYRNPYPTDGLRTEFIACNVELMPQGCHHLLYVTHIVTLPVIHSY